MNEDWTATLLPGMQVLHDQVAEMMKRIERIQPREAKTVFRKMFETEATRFETAAKVARDAADTLQGVADAMRAKLGEVAA